MTPQTSWKQRCQHRLLALQLVAVLALGTQVLLGGNAALQVDSRQRGRVENLSVEMTELRVVHVAYDLMADDPQTVFNVALQVSLDGGQTFGLAATSVSGDVGPGIRPGVGKRIAWEAGLDVEQLEVDRLRYRVVLEIGTALVVVSDPAGATVLIDGTTRGETPLNLNDLPPGEYRVTLVKDRYLENSQVVRLQAGSAETVEVTLSPAEATQPVVESTGGSKLKWILPLVGGAAGAAVAAGAATQSDGSTDSGGGPQTETIIVPAVAGWVAAERRIDPLVTLVSVSASGLWTADPQQRLHGPEGQLGGALCGSAACPSPENRLGALVFRLERAIPTTFVGSAAEIDLRDVIFTMPLLLEFSINDAFLADNLGSMTVTVTPRRN